MAELRYRGETVVEPSNNQRAHEIIDSYLAAVQDSELDVEQGRVRTRDGDVRVSFGLRAETTVEDAAADLDALAQKLVDIGVEPDVETAKESISL
jgi:hypothetical protein